MYTVLMFGDYGWLSKRYDVQEDNYTAWLAGLKMKDDTRLVVVEIGAGTFSPLFLCFAPTHIGWYRRYGSAHGAPAEPESSGHL
jgi:hypothetical protein